MFAISVSNSVQNKYKKFKYTIKDEKLQKLILKIV